MRASRAAELRSLRLDGPPAQRRDYRVRCLGRSVRVGAGRGAGYRSSRVGRPPSVSEEQPAADVVTSDEWDPQRPSEFRSQSSLAASRRARDQDDSSSIHQHVRSFIVTILAAATTSRR